ncbi:MarR family transcriptional regulator [Ammonicoccus fulvus]|uniref:MarR family transcriptional regulator n=1 Tax=Ammonicoccus fulvus TaxID=3138240 RepID=A0ABZ3FS31_9ACTN
MSVSTPDLADLLMRAGRRLRSAHAEELIGLPVNPHQARALRAIARRAPLRPSALAESLRVAPRSATEVVDALVAGGWVERARDPDDGRAMLLDLTAPGRELIGDIDRARARAAEKLLGGLSESERATLAAALGRVVAG